jgi:murein DD-endopeptidase MepM/ murein hydrolase activator NlpD
MLQPPFYAPDRYYLDQIYSYGSTDFGARMPHHGVDYDNPTGTQVYAAADGEVVYVGNDSETLFSPWPDFYGSLIVLEHKLDGEPFYTLYAHLSQIEVQEGDFVSAGDRIGEVGSSGSAIGGHLHFEVRQEETNYSQTRNPELWLAPYETSGVRSGYLAARIVNGQGQLEHVDLTMEFYNFKDGTAPAVWVASYETYLFDETPVGQDERWGENFAQGGLWPGYYKITVLKDDLAYERWVEVLPEHLTYFVMVIDR